MDIRNSRLSSSDEELQAAQVWQFHFRDSPALFNSDLPRQINGVFRDGFGLSRDWSSKGLQKALTESTVIGLLRDPDSDELGGYAFYLVPGVPLQDTCLLWEDAICLRKSLQGRGLSARVLEEVSSLFPDRQFGWLGGRTQNPLVLKRYLHRATLVLPVNLGYESEQGKRVMSFLCKHITEVREPEGMEPGTGICRAVYGGKLGDYKVDLTDPEVADIEHRLTELDFNREGGDAVIAMARLKEPLPKGLQPECLG
jgi:hypothetical protein